MLAAGAPQPDVALGNHAFAEVQLTKRKQYLLNYAFVHEAYFLVVGLLDGGERREYSHESSHRGPICLVHLAQSELAVVRVEEAISAELVLQWQRLRFELDAVFAGDLGPDIQRGCRLLIRVTELEDNLRIAHGEA